MTVIHYPLQRVFYAFAYIAVTPKVYIYVYIFFHTLRHKLLLHILHVTSISETATLLSIFLTIRLTFHGHKTKLIPYCPSRSVGKYRLRNNGFPSVLHPLISA